LKSSNIKDDEPPSAEKRYRKLSATDTIKVQYVLFRDLVDDIPSTTYATHGLYMYPAKFIPQVVRCVIKKYTHDGDRIFDPFAGYGTVAIEASLTGRNCILWDLNPILHLLVRASLYTDPLSISRFILDGVTYCTGIHLSSTKCCLGLGATGVGRLAGNLNLSLQSPS